jgi:hypothetical protein
VNSFGTNAASSSQGGIMVVQLGVTRLAESMVWIEQLADAPAAYYSALIDVEVPEGLSLPVGKQSQLDLERFLARCTILRYEQLW